MPRKNTYIKKGKTVCLLSDEEKDVLLPIFRYQVETDNDSRLFPEIVKLEFENNKTIIVIDEVWKDKLLDYSDSCKEYLDYCYILDEVTSGYTGHYLDIFVCKIDNKFIYLHEDELFINDFGELRFPVLSIELIKALPYTLKRCYENSENLLWKCLSQKGDKYFIKLKFFKDNIVDNFL